jgi:hypothetical protein
MGTYVGTQSDRRPPVSQACFWQSVAQQSNSGELEPIPLGARSEPAWRFPVVDARPGFLELPPPLVSDASK